MPTTQLSMWDDNFLFALTRGKNNCNDMLIVEAEFGDILKRKSTQFVMQLHLLCESLYVANTNSKD